MIGVVDYGAGNLRNVQAALTRLGAAWRPVARPEDLEDVERIILPGVGQFGAAARRLRQAGLADPLRRFIASGGPFLGICLGMQLLFEGSEEDPAAEGLGVLRGAVRRLEARRLPHIGWALVEPAPLEAPDGVPDGRSLFRGLPGSFFAYFAHSFALPPDIEGAASVTSCPPAFASAVRRGPAWGVQFHPEKSGADGQRLLANFARGMAP
jgi:imidazole glycerol phosphate synthase glutamine amidotransferase subunit